MPAQTALDVRAGAGAVEVRSVQGDLKVDAGAGGIEVKGAAGAERLAAGTGEKGSVTATAGEGGIDLLAR